MRVVISGINGFIGSRLRLAMQDKGWEVIPLSRHDFALDSELLAVKLNGADAVINLAGAPIAHRWNESYKKELRDSRIFTTRKIVEAMSIADLKPQIFISTSAVGIYNPESRHTELIFKLAGDFIGQLCRDWETEANNAASFVRTVIFRLGIVLAKDGGAFPRMLLPFRFGLGGKIGNGKQGFSWIHINDLIAAYIFAIENSRITGVFNLTSPEPCDNAAFTKILATLLHRPACFSVPVSALKLIYGEGAITISGGQKAIPERLINAGFQYKFLTIEGALRDILK